ncbi:VOC family protein [Mesorhizobium sp. M0676]|uniref:VOC family protein n=1 Tax=Mesorhizobium sp. M0676 TaxID=2956984 RepID=UPI0033375BA2
MLTNDALSARSSPKAEPALGEMRLEVVVLSVTDIARAAKFYKTIGWREDGDLTKDGYRLLQFTPPGSACSIILSTAASGISPAKFLHLVVADVQTTRVELLEKGVEVSEIFHDETGGYNPFSVHARSLGLHPGRASYLTFATFDDSEGNSWLLQEVTSRLPGR